MGVKIEKADGEVRAFLDGEIDHHCAPSIRNEIDLAVESCRPENLILDFGEVTFMDSVSVKSTVGKGTSVTMKKRILSASLIRAGANENECR